MKVKAYNSNRIKYLNDSENKLDWKQKRIHKIANPFLNIVDSGITFSTNCNYQAGCF